MKKVIRNGVFETNSSSCHSVTKEYPPDKSNNIFVSGSSHIIEERLGEYDWYGDPCCGFDDKLKYALSMLLITEYPGFTYYDENFVISQVVLEDLSGYKLLINAINNTTGNSDTKIIIKRWNYSFYPYGYIDHQSYECYNSLQDFFNDWDITAEDFLFDNSVIVEIGNDN